MAGRVEIMLPKNSLTMTEAEIIEWHVAEGDQVEAGDPLYTMETAKSQVDIEAPAAGTLTQILKHPGEVVPAGVVIAILTTSDESGGSRGLSASVTAPNRTVSEAARALAADLGIDIDSVQGSGTAGRVLEEDVIRAAQAQRATATRPDASETKASTHVSAGGGVPASRAQISRARRAGLQATAPMGSVPVFQLAGTLDFGPARAAMAELGVSISDLLLLACANALDQVPMLNACLRDGEVHTYEEQRIGLLVRARDALLPLVFADPANQPVGELHRRRRQLMEIAGKGPIPVDATRWPTFVISNIGRPGVSWFSTVLYPATAATLAVASVSDDDTASAVLTCDHRIVDGVDAAEFMSALSAAVAEFTIEGVAR